MQAITISFNFKILKAAVAAINGLRPPAAPCVWWAGPSQLFTSPAILAGSGPRFLQHANPELQVQ